MQAYQKRCPFVIDYLIDLARRSGHRLMVRLVKGAYWDSEIKRAQVDGLEGFPVYTRKVHTDVSYLACARKLLAAPDAVFPQFATHNAQTLATIYQMAGAELSTPASTSSSACTAWASRSTRRSSAGADGKLDRPCRIYAPVGTHETLLAYLVRRLLENGANTSFVNRIADQAVSIEELVADPVGQRRDPRQRRRRAGPAASDAFALPRELFGAARVNSRGLDLSQRASRSASLSQRPAGRQPYRLAGRADARLSGSARRAPRNGAQSGRSPRRRRPGAATPRCAMWTMRLQAALQAAPAWQAHAAGRARRLPGARRRPARRRRSSR